MRINVVLTFYSNIWYYYKVYTIRIYNTMNSNTGSLYNSTSSCILNNDGVCTFTSECQGKLKVRPKVRFSFNSIIPDTKYDDDSDSESDDGQMTFLDVQMSRVYLASISIMLLLVILIIYYQ